jgi:hypothetical protein
MARFWLNLLSDDGHFFCIFLSMITFWLHFGYICTEDNLIPRPTQIYTRIRVGAWYLLNTHLWSLVMIMTFPIASFLVHFFPCVLAAACMFKDMENFPIIVSFWVHGSSSYTHRVLDAWTHTKKKKIN